MRDVNYKKFGEFLDMSNEQLKISLAGLKKEKARKVASKRRAIEDLLNEKDDICLWRSSDKKTIVVRIPNGNEIPFEIVQKVLGEKIRYKFKIFAEAVDTAKWLCDGKGNYISD